jgi:hypothetical protein
MRLSVVLVSLSAFLSGEAAEAAAPDCSFMSPTIVGSPGRDVIVGTTRMDVIHGLGGNDLIRGRGAPTGSAVAAATTASWAASSATPYVGTQGRT